MYSPYCAVHGLVEPELWRICRDRRGLGERPARSCAGSAPDGST